MSNANICFYSASCEGSQILISLMRKEGLDKYFHFVSTDNNPNLPPQIRMTPTLIIRGIPTPYVANDAFAWLAKMKQWKINMMMQKMSQAQQQHMKNINNNLTDDKSNLLSFSPAEMEGMSDMFSYLKNDSAMPHSYFEVENIGKEYIFTPPLENGSYKTRNNHQIKINEAKSKEMCRKLQTERKNQDDTFKSAIDGFIASYQK